MLNRIVCQGDYLLVLCSLRFGRYKFEVDDESGKDELEISVTSDLFALCFKNDVLVELGKCNYSLFIINQFYFCSMDERMLNSVILMSSFA